MKRRRIMAVAHVLHPHSVHIADFFACSHQYRHHPTTTTITAPATTSHHHTGSGRAPLKKHKAMITTNTTSSSSSNNNNHNNSQKMKKSPAMSRTPENRVQWRRALTEVKRDYYVGDYRSCSARCQDLLEGAKKDVSRNNTPRMHLIHGKFFIPLFSSCPEMTKITFIFTISIFTMETVRG